MLPPGAWARCNLHSNLYLFPYIEIYRCKRFVSMLDEDEDLIGEQTRRSMPSGCSHKVDLIEARNVDRIWKHL